MRLIVCCMMLCLSASADQWTYFYPETVQRYGCKVEQINVQLAGSGFNANRYQAQAWAERKNGSEHDTWKAEIAVYPPTTKGRRAALKECSRWMDEAEKRIKKAQ